MNKFVSQTNTSLKKKKRRWKPKGRQVENKFYVRAMSETTKYIYEAEIRSAPEDKFQPARKTKLVFQVPLFL